MKLAFPLELSRPNFSEHLQLLKDCGTEEVPIYFMEYNQSLRAMCTDKHFDRMLNSLSLHMDEIAKAGLASHVLYLDFRIKPADIMADDKAAQKWFETICSKCAEHNINDIGFFPNNPERDQTDAAWDDNQAAGYRIMADFAAKYNLRISTHLNMINSSRYDKAADIDDLFTRVGRDNFGLLFCFGCISLAGIDLSEAIYRWRKRIFIVHLRDVDGYWGCNNTEVQFGTGRVKLADAILALRQISYNGILHPEHFPIISSELPDEKSPLFTHAWDRKLLTSTWTLGFWRGILSG